MHTELEFSVGVQGAPKRLSFLYLPTSAMFIWFCLVIGLSEKGSCCEAYTGLELTSPTSAPLRFQASGLIACLSKIQ